MGQREIAKGEVKAASFVFRPPSSPQFSLMNHGVMHVSCQLHSMALRRVSW